MAKSDVRPSGVERTFADDEIIVSKTDTKGILTYVNDLFIKVAVYPESELVGKPHNVIRHPDMPRAIFRLLWDTISDGREIFAYVMNMSGDGAHYWVLAHVTPTRGRNGQIVGYHSNRRTASRAALDQIQPLYRELVAEERKHSSARDAVEASTELLNKILADRGQTYEEFVWSLDTDNPLEKASPARLVSALGGAA
jgi:PAS domain S-box-containing protein